jgi:hypothetical protein
MESDEESEYHYIPPPNPLWTVICSRSVDDYVEMLRVIQEHPEYCRALYEDKYPLHEALQIFAITRDPHIEKYTDLVVSIISHYPEACQFEVKNTLENFCDDDDPETYIALQLAITFHANARIIRSILDAYPDGIHRKSKYDFSPLSLVLANRRTIFEVIPVLLDADPDAISETNGFDDLPLHTAIQAPIANAE